MKTTARENTFRVLSLGISVLLLLYIFQNVDFPSAVRAVSAIGFIGLVVAIAYFVGCIFDTFAWKLLLPSGTSISFLRLLCIHIAGESFYRFIPAGAVAGESVKVMLLKKYSPSEYPVIVSSIVLRKLFMGISQAFYIGSAVLMGCAASGFTRFGSLEMTGVVLALLLLAFFSVFSYWILKGSIGMRVHRMLMKVPIKSIHQRIASKGKKFEETDEVLNKTIQERKAKVAFATLFFFFGWLTELAETALILYLIGITLSISDIVMFEPVVSLLRSIAFMVPGGLGVMDAGYVSALKSFDVHNAAVLSTAFVLLKRGKEVLWICVGMILTVILSGNTAGGLMKDVTPSVAGEHA